VPGLGNVDIGINQLQENGVMFCVCDVAMTVYSTVVAQGMGKDAAEIKKEWVAGLLLVFSCTFRRMGRWSCTGIWMCILFCRIKFDEDIKITGSKSVTPACYFISL